MRTCKTTYRQSSRKIAHDRAKNQENSLVWRRVRGCALLAVLVTLIVAHKAADTGQTPTWSYQAWTSPSAPHTQAAPLMHRADWIGDIIDLIDDIIDIIEGDGDDRDGDGDGDGEGDGEGGDNLGPDAP